MSIFVRAKVVCAHIEGTRVSFQRAVDPGPPEAGVRFKGELWEEMQMDFLEANSEAIQHFTPGEYFYVILEQTTP